MKITLYLLALALSLFTLYGFGRMAWDNLHRQPYPPRPSTPPLRLLPRIKNLFSGNARDRRRARRAYWRAQVGAACKLWCVK